MRMFWRAPTVLMLAILWPQLGCVQLFGGKSSPQTRPLQEAPSVKPRPELSPAEKAQSLLQQADSLEKTGKSKDAVALYEKLRQFGGDYALVATRRLAIIYDRNNDLERAEQEYQLLLQHDKKDADTLCYLGYVHYRRGHMGTAAKCFEDATFFNPDHKEAWINLGFTLAHEGDYDRSITTFKKYFSEADAYCNVAFVLNLQNKREDAMRAYQAALNLDSKMDRARVELAKMELTAPLQSTPTTVVNRLPPPKLSRPDLPGRVDLEEVVLPVAHASSDGLSRLMIQRPTLPPLPDLDLTATNGTGWECSAKKDKTK